MLDLDYCKGERFLMCSCLDFSLFVKPTSIWRPLSPESMHPVTVHEHWPINQCARIRKRFSDAFLAEKAVQKFECELLKVSGAAVGIKAFVTRTKAQTSWLVLPFDFVLGGSKISSVVSDIHVPESLRSVFSQVRVSWKLGNKRLMHLLRPRRDDVG